MVGSEPEYLQEESLLHESELVSRIEDAGCHHDLHATASVGAGWRGRPWGDISVLGYGRLPTEAAHGHFGSFFQSLHVASEKPVQFSSVYISVIFRVFPLSHVATDYYGVDAREGDTSNF